MNKYDTFLDGFVKSLDKTAQATLAFYLQKDLMLKNFANSKEMQKIKEEITNEVLHRVSIRVVNTVYEELDKILKI